MRSVIVLAWLASLAGCARDVYQLHVQPQGESFQRTLTCWHERGTLEKPAADAPLDEDQLNRIGRAYPPEGRSTKGMRTTFTGMFRAATPGDVGGSGWYRYDTSPLGSAGCYVERFRGNDNLEAELAARRVATDQLADLIVAWMQAELGNRPNFSQLKQFLNDDFRHDLRNLSVYCWTAEANGSLDRASAEFVVRIGQYLNERGYLTPADLPNLARTFATSDPGWLWSRVQRLVADKLRVPAGQAMPDWLAFLGDHEKALASFLQYVRSSDVYKKQAARARDAKRSHGPAEEPKPEDVAGELFIEGILPPGALGGADRVELTLSASQPPYHTNGRWDAAAAAVQYRAGLAQKSALPAFFYAFWSQPDEAFQQAHFGRRVLEGDGLAQYVFWYRCLSADQRREWDDFVAGCRPGAELAARIEAFRFAGERPAKLNEEPAAKPAGPPKAGVPQAKRLSQVPRDLLLPALAK